MPEPARMETAELAAVWAGNWAQLGQDDAAVQAIDTAIDTTRADMLEALAELD